MKTLLLLALVFAAIGCGSSAAPVAEQPKDPTITKLESIPVGEREAYVKAHPEEFGLATPKAGQ